MVITGSSVELLESRIAPALLFVSGATSGKTALHVFDESGIAVSDASAAALSGTTVAVLLHAGDKLLYDPDHNHALSPGDVTMVKVTAGSAMVFLTNGKTGTDLHKFELSELTGLAVSDGFAGSVNTTIRGSVITALDGDGHFTATEGVIQVQDAHVASLTVNGRIKYSFVAGHGADNVTILGSPAFSSNGSTPYSVKYMLAGSATTLPESSSPYGEVIASLDGGVHRLNRTFTPSQVQEDGGSFTHLNLNYDAVILAGKGYGGGAGGSITDIHIAHANFTVLGAGAGGAGSGINPGGAGGSIERLDLGFAQYDNFSGVAVYGGIGGNSEYGLGGAGGSVDQVVMRSQVRASAAIRAGDGGASTAADSTSPGGKGGDITNLNLSFVSPPPLPVPYYGPAWFPGEDYEYPSATRVLAGSGGKNRGTGLAGAGGEVAHLQMLLSRAHAQVNGGQPALGGVAGNLTDLRITVSGDGGADLHAEGIIQDISLNHTPGPRVPPGFDSRSSVVEGSLIQHVHYTNTSNSHLTIRGIGAGNVDHVTIFNTGLLDLHINHNFGLNPEGNGGDLSNLTIQNSGFLSGAIFSGEGGGGGSHPSGDSGALRNIHIAGGEIGSDQVPFRIGPGRTPFTSTTHGGSIGEMSNIEIRAPRGVFTLGDFAPGAVTGVGGQGGRGGDISHVTATVKWIASVAATSGGAAPSGTGGDGGNISDVHITATFGIVGQVVAGDGGDGQIPGAGGSVSDFSTNGDVGLFNRRFGFAELARDTSMIRMGGIAAGRGGQDSNGQFGLAGSITDVSANRIAAMLAGAPAVLPQEGFPMTPLGYENAVTSISNVQATVIGADVGIRGKFHQGRFDFNNPNPTSDGMFEPNAAHDPGDGDIAIDGLVLVKKGGLLTPLPIKPLLLIEV